MATATTVQATRPPFWRNIRVLRAAGQFFFVVVLVLVAREIFLNLQFNYERQGLDLDYDFLNSRAGFGIKESSFGLEYTSNDTFIRAFIVAAANTLRAALTGIVLASIVGLVVGVARLSPNWVVRKLAQVYVDIFRNTPALIQVIFWSTAVFLALPAIGNSISFFNIAFVSNRAAAVPWFEFHDGAAGFGLALVVALVAAAFVWRWRTRVNEATGDPAYRFLWGAGAFLAVAAVAYAITGAPVGISVPEQLIRNYEGGYQLSVEFAAIVVGLTLYTAAFIAEIIRGSILAVSKGQKEAAEALGLTAGQQLRLVVLPQAMRVAIPPINSQYLNLTKNTSLAFAIGFPEIINVSTTIINQAGRALQVVFFMMATYLLFSLVISAIMNLINRRVALRGATR